MAVFGLVTYLSPAIAHAQRAAENALNSADDAFGTSVGVEQTGIYSENDARGFSPKKAGNVRLDGIYFDQVSSISGRLKDSTAIRIGFAAERYPFHAPTGVVDQKLKGMPEDFGASLALHRTGYWGSIGELDVRVPVVKDHIGLIAGMAYADSRQSDGVESLSWGVSFRPIVRFGGVELTGIAHIGWWPSGKPESFVVIQYETRPTLPRMTEPRRYLGEPWTNAGFDNQTFGATLKASITDRLSFRGGIFRSSGKRTRSFADIFTMNDDNTTASHLVMVDPVQDVHSTSGEGLFAYRFATGRWEHRVFAGFRARNRYTESGGSDYLFSNNVPVFGEPDPIPLRDLHFTPVNAGRVKQSSILLGYTGELAGLGSINLGLQKARYRATVRDGVTGLITSQRDDPWLYNMGLGIDLSRSLSLYLGVERGLEDSGTAPVNAVNANAQLPSTRTTQYEGGLRWKFHGGQLAVNLFQIDKPYFSFDANNIYAELGSERHRGVEVSLSGHFGKRLSLVAGGVFMKPTVTGAGRDAGLVGERPTGTPSVYARIDANYRTDLLGGLTPTLTVIHTGSRAASERPFASLGDKQLMVTAYTTVDIGIREQFHIGKVPASFRFVLQNAFDAATWKVVAANTLTADERRRFMVSIAADF